MVTDINLLLILIRQMTALVRRALAEVIANVINRHAKRSFYRAVGGLNGFFFENWSSCIRKGILVAK